MELDDIKGVYNAKNHPDVRAKKKTEDDVLCEFLDTFEAHHATFREDTRDRRITTRGIIVIKAQQQRTQERNRAEALERLRLLILGATERRKPRREMRVL